MRSRVRADQTLTVMAAPMEHVLSSESRQLGILHLKTTVGDIVQSFMKKKWVRCSVRIAVQAKAKSDSPTVSLGDIVPFGFDLQFED